MAHLLASEMPAPTRHAPGCLEAMNGMNTADLNRTVLNEMHHALGAKMVPFAGYEMPVQFPQGVMAEHLHTRTQAGLFDVSHMGQIILRGNGADAALETLVPVDVTGLAVGRQRYGFFTNQAGGIEDDLMITRRDDHLLLVVNAARKTEDFALLQDGLQAQGITVERVEDRALLALQGPAAESALSALVPGVSAMRFMDVISAEISGQEIWISRSGYTGEDGFELSVPEQAATTLTERLLQNETVAPIGLGARDSLRLEAGLCLYGHDIDATTTPVEAGLTWAISKPRRAGGDRAGGFVGADVILRQMENGPSRRRVGLRPEGRAPMREGVPLFTHAQGGDPVGHVTSGGFGPSVGAPVAMGYVPAEMAGEGSKLFGEVRGKRLPVIVGKLPFVTPGFKR